MTEWYVGTMGYSYKDWSGNFYPNHVRSNTYLQTYSKIFNAVEMDTTFYAIPTPAQIQRWVQQTPKGFLFCPKTPREITHDGNPFEKIKIMKNFLTNIRSFNERLGAILIQFPPNFTFSEFNLLSRFLNALPVDLTYAVEFRHRSWDIEETRALLRATGICWVSPEYIILKPALYITADFAYIRFLGKHGAFSRKNRLQRDVQPLLQKWWGFLLPKMNEIHTVYSFFNNDFSGHAPTTCNQFKNVLGLPVTEPDLPVQGRLF